MSNPLVQPKRRFAKNADPLRRPTRPGTRKISGSFGPADSRTAPPRPRPTSSTSASQALASAVANGSSSSSSSDNSNYREYNLNACSEDDIKDLRYHLMRFHSKQEVDPSKEFIDDPARGKVKHFIKPVRLHRKDPRNMQNQLTIAELEERNKRMGITTPIPKGLLAEAAAAEAAALGDVQMTGDNDDETRDDEKGDGKQKGKIAPEEADMSLIAPDGGARRGKSHLFQKKTRQVLLGDPDARKLRYEEYYPWVIEDFDGKNTWVGNYEAGQADSYVLFVFDNDGFKMVPAEKWYKMTPRNKYATLTSEEAEKQMTKGEQPNRWVMKYFGETNESEGVKRPVNMRRRFRTTDNNNEDELRRDDDGNDIDFDEEFADDEEAPIMEGNEDEVKEVEKKIKKEHQSAKISALFNDDENEEEEDDDGKVDKQGKHMIKYLRSREKNINYDTDDDSNPYATDESSDDDEEPENSASLGGALKGDAANDDKIKQEPGSENAKPENGDAAGDDKPKKKLKENKLKEKKRKRKLAKKLLELPRGMVILSLPSARLAQFPPDSWNPGVKRRRAETTDQDEALAGVKQPKVKKLKTKISPKVEAETIGTLASSAIPAGTTPSTGSLPTPAPSANSSMSATITPLRTATREGSVGSGTESATTQSQTTSASVPAPAVTTTASNGAVATTNRRSVSPTASSAATGAATPAATNGTSGTPGLITEEEVKEAIRNRQVTIKELLTSFQNRIKRHPGSLALLKSYLKRVAKLHEGYLVLRENT